MGLDKTSRRLGALAVAGLFAGCINTGYAVKQTACANFSFPVYFASGSDQLTTPAVQAIGESALRAKGCPVAVIAIKGLGRDTTGLAARRAAAVARALAANGLDKPAPVADSATGGPEFPLLNRRVDVSVTFSRQP